MAHYSVSVETRTKCLMKEVWELPSAPDGEFEPENEKRHAKGMIRIKQMIAAGADQSRPAKFGGSGFTTTPMIVAAANGDAICLSFLLSAPFASPDFVDECGECALTHAARYGSSKCVAMLAPFCDPNIKDSFGHTALAVAMLNGNSEAVAILAPITDLNARDDEGKTARQLAESDARQYLPLLDSILERLELDEAIGAGSVGQAEHPGCRRRSSL